NAAGLAFRVAVACDQYGVKMNCIANNLDVIHPIGSQCAIRKKSTADAPEQWRFLIDVCQRINLCISFSGTLVTISSKRLLIADVRHIDQDDPTPRVRIVVAPI
ncbi:MAG: hypothetical protein B7Z60_09990, partial [Ferrovum sp. 37-45-19]